MNGNSTFGVLVVVVLIVLVVWACVSRGEKFMPERGTSMYSLGDNAYARYQLPDYSENVNYGFGLREDYHPHTLCKMKCRYETGSGRNAVCIDQCMREQTGRDYSVSCSKDDDCPHGDICVMGGAYSGMSHKGECMDPREPFEMDTVEGFASPVTCYPGDYFNESAGRCEPRFQGPSSAWAIHHQPQPEHPEVWIPGATTPGYGVGTTDPYDVPTDVTIY